MKFYPDMDCSSLLSAQRLYDGTNKLLNEAESKNKHGYSSSLFQSRGPGFATPRMLLVGQTGSGKTSFLNLLCNFSVLIDTVEGDPVIAAQRFQAFNDIKLEQAQEDKMKSKTDNAKRYTVQHHQFALEVIDTPGFGDTRGVEVDKKHIENIVKSLGEVPYINSICLVIQGREARMNKTLEYVLNSVASIMPKSVLNNVIAVFTNCADSLDLNFDVTSFGQVIDGKVQYYCIENPYCRLENAKEKQDKLALDRIAKDLRKSFHTTLMTLKDIVTKTVDLPEVYTNDFMALYETKKKIEIDLIRALALYQRSVDMDKELKKQEEQLKETWDQKIASEAKINEMVDQKLHVWEPKPHNTLCKVQGCHGNCHISCGLAKTLDSRELPGCGAMSENCGQCKHQYHQHQHCEYLWERVEKGMWSDLELKKIQSKLSHLKIRQRHDCKPEQMVVKSWKDLPPLIKSWKERIDIARMYATSRKYAISPMCARIYGDISSDQKETPTTLRIAANFNKEVKYSWLYAAVGSGRDYYYDFSKKKEIVESFLSQCDLVEEYTQKFLQVGCDSRKKIKSLTETDLKNMNVKKFHHRKILAAAQSLQNQPQGKEVVESFLSQCDLVQEYTQKFLEAGCDNLNKIKSLTETDLKNMSVKKFHRRKILAVVQSLQHNNLEIMTPELEIMEPECFKNSPLPSSYSPSWTCTICSTSSSGNRLYCSCCDLNICYPCSESNRPALYYTERFLRIGSN